MLSQGSARHRLIELGHQHVENLQPKEVMLLQSLSFSQEATFEEAKSFEIHKGRKKLNIYQEAMEETEVVLA